MSLQHNQYINIRKAEYDQDSAITKNRGMFLCYLHAVALVL